MVLSARGGAGVIAVAVGDALGAPLGADEVGQSLSELSDVGAEAVTTLAGVCEGVCVAAVVVHGAGLRGWLQADQLEECVSMFGLSVMDIGLNGLTGHCVLCCWHQ